MNINIETTQTQNVTSEQLDILAKYLCGVKLTLSDTGVPVFPVESISTNRISAISNTSYQDTKTALYNLGVDIASAKTFVRILDPVVVSKLLLAYAHADPDAFTPTEFANITSLQNSLFRNTNVQDFSELKYTGVTSIPNECFHNCSLLRYVDLSNITTIQYQAFTNCPSISNIDFSNVTSIGAQAFEDCVNIKEINDMSKLTSIGTRAFGNVKINHGITFPRLQTIASDSNPYGVNTLPYTDGIVYCPSATTVYYNAVFCGGKSYVYLPELITFHTGYTNYGFFNTPRLLSIGETAQTLGMSFMCYTNSSTPTSISVVHSDSFQIESGDKDQSDSWVLYGHPFFIEPQTISVLYEIGYRNKMMQNCYFIGSNMWVQKMQELATEKNVQLQDENMDFRFKYVDYVIGGIPIPVRYNQDPTSVKMYTIHGDLQDNDDFYDIYDELEILIDIDSRKNKCSLSLSNNNANVTLNDNVITIPSTANGETVTITCVSDYDSNVRQSVTVNVYAYDNKVSHTMDIGSIKALHDNYFKGKYEITTTDLQTISKLPAKVFYQYAIVNADWFQYTNVNDYTYDSYTYNSGFSNCDQMQSIVFPQTLTVVPPGVCSSCSSLTSVTLHNNMTRIYKYAFYRCTSLQSITIPNSVTRIDENAFLQSGLTSVTIPDSVTTLEGNIFNNCTNLTSATIGSGLTEIPGSTFRNCTNLSSITIPNSVTSIKDGAFGNTGFTSLPSLGSVTTIPGTCFQSCTKLTGDLIIPSGIVSIGSTGGYSYVFQSAGTSSGNPGLNDVIFPEGLQWIGTGTLDRCRINGQIVIPSTCQHIYNDAFCGIGPAQGNPKPSIKFKGNTPPDMHGNDAGYFNLFSKIYVPQGYLSTYQTAFSSASTYSQWSSNIEEYTP